MRAGRLRRLVSIQYKAVDSPPKDSFGADQFTWTELAQVWAAVEPMPLTMRSREFFEASQRQGVLYTRVVIRYRSDVDQTMRVVDGSDVHNIVAPPINTDSRNFELQLLCAKGAGDG